MNEKRSGAICFWSFVFSMVLVIFHAYLLSEDNAGQLPFIFTRGSVATEFFFVAAGYLMAEYVNRLPDGTVFNWKDTWSFLRGGLKPIYPAFFITWAVTFVTVNIVFYDGLKTLAGNLLGSVFELTMVRSAGFNGYRLLSQTWVLSAAVIAFFVLYPLYRLNKKRFEYFIAPAVALLLLGYLFYKTRRLSNTEMFMTLGFKSTYRAVGEICLGVVCFVACRALRDRELSRAKSHLLSAAELSGYILALAYMQFWQAVPRYFDFIVLMCFAVSITISFSQKSSISPLFDRKVFRALGRFSLYPYLTFRVFVTVLPTMMPTSDILTAELVYIALTVVLAAAVMTLEKPFVSMVKTLGRMIVKRA